jgi:hypothetical protein
MLPTHTTLGRARPASPTLDVARRAVAAKTDKDYRRALDRFTAWVVREGYRVSDPSDWDRALAKYMEVRFSAGDGRALGEKTLAALVHFRPDLGHRLPLSRRTAKGWAVAMPVKSRPPLTWSMVCAIAFVCWSSGRRLSALAFMLAFDCYLRREEIAQVRGDLLFDAPDGSLLLVLPKCKTGNNQSVTVRNTVIVGWLRKLRGALHAGDLLFPSGRALLLDLTAACECLGLGGLGFKLHSLRSGGATADFMAGAPLTFIQERGRWRQFQTLQQTYLQAAPAVTAMSAVPRDTARLGMKLASDVGKYFRGMF